MDFQKSNFEVTSEIRRKRNSFNIPKWNPKHLRTGRTDRTATARAYWTGLHAKIIIIYCTLSIKTTRRKANNLGLYQTSRPISLLRADSAPVRYLLCPCVVAYKIWRKRLFQGQASHERGRGVSGETWSSPVLSEPHRSWLSRFRAVFATPVRSVRPVRCLGGPL